MANLAVCRICLSYNVKINSINTQLQVIYEIITGSKLNIGDERPLTVCYICHSQLRKCCQIQEKYQKSGDILTALLVNGIEISSETVAVLNKEIDHNFCVTPVETDTYCTTLIVKDEVDVKNEVSDDSGMFVIDVPKYEREEMSSNLCRFCLSANATRSIINTRLQGIYEKLTNTKLDVASYESLVCNICRAQLRRCRRLLVQARTSYKILAELAYNSVQLTPHILSDLNKNNKPCYTTTTVLSTCHCVKCRQNENTLEIKKEVMDIVIHGMMEDEMIDFADHISYSDQDTKLETNTTNTHEICNICNYKCHTVKRFKKHLKLHDPKRKYQCDICAYRFTSSYSLNIHKRVHKYEYRCGKCQRGFSDKTKYVSHKFLHKNSVFSCEKCRKVFKNHNALRSHYNVHKDSYLCKHCDYKSPSKKWLQDHILRVHAKSSHFICDICHKTLSRKSAIKLHLMTHAEKKPYECKICLKTFTTQSNLKLHNMSHTKEKPFICNVCKRSYRQNRQLKIHLLTHGYVRPYSCDICDKEFLSKTALNHHRLSHNPEKIYTCELCDKTFLNNTYVKKHMLSHTEERPYPCDICHKTFKNKTGLRTHKIVHDGKKIFICDICDRSFTRKMYLVGHMRYHTGTKTFPCDICAKYFATKQILEAHRRTHTGERPYACTMCNKSFTQTISLKRHINSHNSIKPYHCDACNKRFADKNNMIAHKITYHTRANSYICDICSKVFIDKNKIENHIKYHSARPYECEMCQKTFFELCNFTQHARNHTEIKCAFCEDKFISKTALMRHNLQKHNGVKRFACNVCEKPIESLKMLNSHTRNHTGAKQFACELCEKTYVERRDLIHHMKTVHNKLKCF